MGGRAFPHLHVPRLSPAEYERIRDEYTKILQKFYAQVACPAEAPEKDDHGDVDFLVAEPVRGFSPDELKLALKAVDQTAHNPKSYAVPLNRDGEGVGDGKKPCYAQIDVQLCDDLSLRWKTWNGAYGDLSQIIEILLRPVGLKMTDKGLYLNLKLANPESASPIFLTKDAVKVREFLGLDEEEYQRGFQTLENLFEWCSRGKFFKAPAKGSKPRKRWVFDLFLQWAPSHAEAWASHPLSRSEVLPLAVKFFNVDQQVRLQVNRDQKLTAIMGAVSETKDSGDGGKQPKLERWIRFEDDGSPVLRPISGENEPGRMLRSEWLDSIQEGRLEHLLDWLKVNLTELGKRDKVWVTKKILSQQLADALFQSLKKADLKSGHLNSKRFKNEVLGAGNNALDPACTGPGFELLKKYHSCKQLVDGMTSLDPEENVRSMIEEFKSS